MSITGPFDVCLIYEHPGELQDNRTQAWVDKMIRSMPTLNFAIITVHASDNSNRTPDKLFDNPLHHQVQINLPEQANSVSRARGYRRDTALTAAPELLDALFKGEESATADALKMLQRQLAQAPENALATFLHSEANFQMLRKVYERNVAGSPFNDFFTLARELLTPLYALSGLVESLPVAHCYHSLTSGHAGFLGTLLQRKHGARLICSDQGVINLPASGSDNSAQHRNQQSPTTDHIQLWLRLRDAMKRVTEHDASLLTTASQFHFDAYRNELGTKKKIHLIPNGIDLEYFSHFFSPHAKGPPHIVATIGPVIPSRDIKSFIRAIASLRERLPHVMAWVVGSLSIDSRYSQECQSLVRNLGLYNHLRFFGDQDESTIYPRIGVMVINTVSDIPPISLHHAQATGVPVVATRVGANSEFIEGRDEQDRKLGQSGSIVPIADPAATAKAIQLLLEDRLKWKAARETGVVRCNKYYSLESMLQQYRVLYQPAPAGN